MDETHGLRCDVLQIAPNFAPNIRSGVITPYTGCLAAPGVSSPETLRPAGGDPVLVTGVRFGATTTGPRSPPRPSNYPAARPPPSLRRVGADVPVKAAVSW